MFKVEQCMSLKKLFHQKLQNFQSSMLNEKSLVITQREEGKKVVTIIYQGLCRIPEKCIYCQILCQLFFTSCRHSQNAFKTTVTTSQYFLYFQIIYPRITIKAVFYSILILFIVYFLIIYARVIVKTIFCSILILKKSWCNLGTTSFLV